MKFPSATASPLATQKIDYLTGGVHGTVEELVLPFHLYIGLVGAVAFVGGLQM